MAVAPHSIGGEERDDRAALERWLSALTEHGSSPRPRGDHIDARCPVPEHDDHNPSLSIDWKPELRNGGAGVAVNCHGGCNTADVCSALAMSYPHDLYDVPRYPRAGAAPRTPRPASGTPKKKRTKDRSAGDARTWPVTATYTYADDQGTVVGEVLRKEPPDKAPGDGRKTFIWRRPSASGRMEFGAPAERPLYRLPEVLAAAEAGATVYVVEGEKDADAIAELGETATCNPGGAWDGRKFGDRGQAVSRKWRPEHTAALNGAHVIIVADRDEVAPKAGYAKGYRHAWAVARELTGVAASVRIVHAASGKDTTDHLAAGHTLADLAPVEDSALIELARPELLDDPVVDTHGDGTVVPGPWRHGGGGGGSSTPPPEIEVIGDHYAVIGDDLCKVTYDKPDPDTGIRPLKSAKRVLNVAVRMARRVRRDMGDGSPVKVSHVDLEARRGDERQELAAVPWEDFEGCKWIADLDWPDTQYTRTAGGRSNVVNAIAATSGDVPTVTAYGTIGWREIPDASGDGTQWAYLHDGGGIGAAGAVADVRVDLPVDLTGYHLPDPLDLDDTDGIRAALDASVAILNDLPAHLAAPMLGAAYRALLGTCETTVFALGTKGSGKSALAALALQHYMPSAKYNRLTIGAGEDASTVTAMEHTRYLVGDALCVADDLAPDRGAERSTQRANILARSQYNHQGKRRGTKDDTLRASRPPRGLQVITGEDGASGSGESRVIYVPVGAHDMELDTLIALARWDHAMHRARLIATMARWCAARMPLTTWTTETTEAITAELRSGQAGLEGRTAGMVADLATGWRALLDMAVQTGAWTPEHAREVWARAWDGLTACHRQQSAITSRRDPVQRAADLLRSALISGRAHIAEVESGAAPDDARLWGWDVPGGSQQMMGEAGARALGDGVGWTDGTTLWLDKGMATTVLERQGRAEADPLGLTARALGQALADAGVLARRRQATQWHNDVRVTILGRQMCVWQVPVTWLYPDDSGSGDPGAPADPPTLDMPPDPPSDTQDAPTAPEPPAPVQDAPDGGSGPQNPSEGRDMTVRTQTRYRAPAAVLELGSAWFAHPDRMDRVDLPPMTTLADVAAWAADQHLGTAHTGHHDDDGQVWLMPDLAGALGLPARKPGEREATKHAALKPLREAGWEISRAGLGPWTSAWRSGAPSVRMAVVGWQDRNDCPLVVGDRAVRPVSAAPLCSAPELAVRIGLYAARVTLPWRVSCAVTGVDLMDLARPAGTKGAVGEAATPCPPAERRTTEADTLWCRTPLPSEAAMPYLHGIDIRGMHLSAASSVELGLGPARHVEDPGGTFDARIPGYHRVEVPRWELPLPNLFDPRARAGRQSSDTRWLTTPALAYARDDLDIPIKVLESYVYDDHGRHLEPWYKILREARAALLAVADDPDADAVYAAVKRTYTNGIGRLGADATAGDRLYRPDHRHHVIARARANALRKWHATGEQTGRYPLIVATDCAYYPSNSPDPASVLPPRVGAKKAPLEFGTGLGQCKHDGTYPLTDEIEITVFKRGEPHAETVRIAELLCDGQPPKEIMAALALDPEG